MHSQTSAIPTTNIMTRLKNETATAHKQLEKSPCFKRLFAKDYTMNEYRLLMSYFYGYFNEIEPLLFTTFPNEYQNQLQYRIKTPLIKQDLSFLGVNSDTLTHCEILPVLNTFAKKIGVLYVLEGSMLGGRVIAEQLVNHFGSEIKGALNFYTCYGESLNTQWQSFVLFMNEYAHDKTESEHNEIIDSANETFNSLQNWVESH